MRSKTNVLMWVVVFAAVLLCVRPVRAQEGFDPMRQITSQWVRPDILLIMDVSGSMAWDKYGTDVGVDSAGTWVAASWTNVTRESGYQSRYSCSWSSTQNATVCKVWVYRLTVQQRYPSRMCTVKNAMGNSVSIITQWFPPGYTDADPEGVWAAPDVKAWTTLGGTLNAGDPAYGTSTSGSYTRRTFTWTLTYQVGQVDPGIPYVTDPLLLIVAQPPTFGYGVGSDTGKDASKICQQLAPADLIGKTAQTVNWGLETFSGSDCDTETLNVAINSNDTGDVTALENAMRLNWRGGQGASGSTPTRGAVEYAKTVMTNTFNADPKKTCGRTYATILMTDGLSNMCNPGDGNWIDPCGSVVPYKCDGGSGGYDCDQRDGSLRQNSYQYFPAKKVEELYNLNLTAGGKTYKVRTWVIGVSDAVSPCELNFNAYMGRTDASAPTGDAGFSLADDPNLPTSTGDASKYTIDSSHPAYAYFATSSLALQDAFANILGGLGAGDYSTSAPSLAAFPINNDSVGLLTSATYPTWQGHVYAYDLKNQTTRPDPYAFPLLWDAGYVLSTGLFDGTGDGVPDPNNGYPRQIWTWDQKGNITTVKAIAIDNSDTATAQKLEQLCAYNRANPCGITPAVVDFIRGYDGTLTNTRRTWTLSAIINSTPAITGPPEIWRTGLLVNHQGFEQTYKNRHQLAWVGSSDGMVHAFDMVDGAEILALLPPDLLKWQVTLYNQYVDESKKASLSAPVGQKKDPQQHIYGVANSLRVADVWNPATSEYRTLLFITEGPGGSGIHAVDITHPYPQRTGVHYKVWAHSPPLNDNDFTVSDATDFPSDCGVSTPCTTQFDPLWSLTVNGSADTNTLADLGQTWAVPALGATDATTWQLVVGNGWGTWDTSKTPPQILLPSPSAIPKVLRLNPNTGAVLSSSSLANETISATGAFVTNEAFADNGTIQTNSQFFHPDNIVDQAVQLDLHGHVWLMNKTSSWTPTKLTDSGGVIVKQPLYYAAALSPFPSQAPTHDVYAFSSGTFYEKNPTVSGPNIGVAPNFIPAVILATRKLSDGSVSVGKFALKDMNIDATTKLGRRSQITQYPLLLVPRPGTTGKAIALYLVYDPAAGTCVGSSYAVIGTFDPMSLGGATFSVQFAGTGAAAGYAVDPAGKIHVAQSFVGTGGQAYFPGSLALPALPPAGGLGATIAWWAELQ